ncbi:class I SAM-dependent methyltransferase [Clostridium sp. 'deep sea']|uniref:class I SAM-dependent methyltransferase n=1 Tax=Clostridium sp. 'deep sea' TaxID=2779445 RepID=UPI0018965E9E|nr:class I SAM-dependent methyltransferase [Clostridium sp. 'deep sea']QOR35110.1 class I SAM-dependent methyltransferase [Clostridium sp. 'deep sea']
MQIYDSSALYNQNMADNKQQLLKDFYNDLFKGLKVKMIHDCSIGAGGTSLPLAKLGYDVSGSDISENLLKKAKENFNKAGYDINLYNSDFRELNSKLPNKYDCIISTGNSLPHICNNDVDIFLKEVSAKLNDKGYLYIDIRNWDLIVKEKPSFKAFDPMVMTNTEHKSLYQFWNWYKDGSVDFVFVTSTDKNGKHEKHIILTAPTYYPLILKDYTNMLKNNGYRLVGCYDLDSIWLGSKQEQNKIGDFTEDFNYINWYGILAQKL